MVKIRKSEYYGSYPRLCKSDPTICCCTETSKRVSIKDRESKKKKVKDGRKKNRKLAKKDVTWKSSGYRNEGCGRRKLTSFLVAGTKKDPGMPNAMPFKDLIIAEMEQAKLSVCQVYLTLFAENSRGAFTGRTRA